MGKKVSQESSICTSMCRYGAAPQAISCRPPRGAGRTFFEMIPHRQRCIQHAPTAKDISATPMCSAHDQPTEDGKTGTSFYILAGADVNTQDLRRAEVHVGWRRFPRAALDAIRGSCRVAAIGRHFHPASLDSATEVNVLDLFGGSGPTLFGCEQTGRKAFLMELDEPYCDVIRRWWAEFVHGAGCDWQALTAVCGRRDDPAAQAGASTGVRT